MGWEHVLGRDDYELFRRNRTLLDEQVCAHFSHGSADPGILAAIRAVPRHLFVNAGYRLLAYTDNALPTLAGLTTSAPSVIAEMIYQSGASRGSRVLEIGTGTGYEAAVLAEMGARVVSVEIDATLASFAGRVLFALGYLERREAGEPQPPRRSTARRTAHQDTSGARRVDPAARAGAFPGSGMIELIHANGQAGCAEHAPFDAIIVAASVARFDSVRALAAQLSPGGGRLVVPVGLPHAQQLCIAERRGRRVEVAPLDDATFDFVRLVAQAVRRSTRQW